ncbi:MULTISPECIES: thioredoxin family protein [Flavobacterium]|uniref:thioredoxin family protein n=1 Tax=Flavobacterium TaxID=237 RepID=UPI00086E4B2E|nr:MULTISPECIES: thioredoxin family protein [Flavobacterium]MBN9283830.1 thioredoxin family protein [Flavobacterium sp.]ODS77746.1 MAG: redoxin [Chryseobacterium sp. SCN 40-13]OJV68666.1 MAG: thioredoxin family protein [Flavobacterium sp. 40-81]
MKAIKFLGLALVIGVMSAFTLIKPAEGYKVGDIATDFSLKNVDNKKVSLKDFSAAKGFIVVFTCNHCPYAQAYEDRIVALDKKYKKLGYPVIAINPNNPAKQKDDSFELMQVRAKEKNFTFPYLLDEGQKIYPQYGATKTPHVYILQKTKAGNQVKYIGAIDDNYGDEKAVKVKYVENAVDALLKNKEVAVKETKAIGCSIKA